MAWSELFERGGGGRFYPYRVVRREGHALLVLPLDTGLAARAMALYPAQRFFARAAKLALTWALKLKLPLPIPKEQVRVAQDDPLGRFLAEIAGSSELPPLAILAGNPHAEGRRFIVLVFGQDRCPAGVVKAGVTKKARQLVERERHFLELEPVADMELASPRVFNTLESGRVSAFAMQFIEGNAAPPTGEEEKIAAMIGSLLDRTRQMRVMSIPMWQRLEKACASRPLMAALTSKVGNTLVHPAIYHGDLTPWNIKVDSKGDLTVLDWERGELTGIPGWDWFHYVVQVSILVQRMSASGLAERLESLLFEPEFDTYAGEAGIGSVRRELALAYVLYAVHVLKPAEGTDQLQALLDELSRRWL